LPTSKVSQKALKSHENKHINQNPLADSAGVPWAGRELQANTFADDDGSASLELIRAIEKFHQTLDPAEVFQEFKKSRLLIPLIAVLGESDIGAHGQTVDKSAELSIVNVKTPDDQVGLPVFSSVETMRVWNSEARPVPHDAVRVALSAASEGNTRIILDPGSATEFAFRRAAIAALAQSLDWQAPYLDKKVVSAYESAIKDEPDITDITVTTADPQSRLAGPEVQIQLEAKSGLSKSQLEDVLQRLIQKWAESEVIVAAVDSISLKVKPASGAS
jgi:hypothetical protein